jgi:galactokinase
MPFNASSCARTLEAAGLEPDAASACAARFVRLLEHLGTTGASAWFVPGRMEVLGKHTDYAGGRSIVCALERGFCVVSAPRADGILAVTDIGRGSRVVLDHAAPAEHAKWGTYPATVQRRLRRNFPDAARGADVVLESRLPSAAGLSSSSALMIGVLLALVRANDLDADPRWQAQIQSLEDLAAYAATIENGRDFKDLAGEAGVGTAGGSEDHTAILCSTPNHLAQYSYLPTRRERTIPLDPELVFVVGASGITASKIGNARDDYNRASLGLARILEHWRSITGRQDVSLAEALDTAPDAVVRLRRSIDVFDATLLDRFDQFVEESTVLVLAAGEQLATGDWVALGATTARSQELAERLLRNQVPETSALARLAYESGAIAASAFGAGFGGSVWALVERGTAHAFVDRWQNAYAAACPGAATKSSFFLTRPGPAVVQVQ